MDGLKRPSAAPKTTTNDSLVNSLIACKRTTLSFAPNFPVRGQVFRVYFYENGGARNLMLTLNINDVNKAKRL